MTSQDGQRPLRYHRNLLMKTKAAPLPAFEAIFILLSPTDFYQLKREDNPTLGF